MKQEDFYKLANKGYNIFLTWIWWSWKTFALNKWKEENHKKKIVTCSPTWIAAIQSWWVTIHSMFNLYWDNYHIINKTKVDFNKVDTLIIDEISMVSIEMFDFIDKSIRRQTLNNKPFWWIQVICVWDLAQLQPVYNTSEPLIKERYNKLIKDYWWVEFNKSKSFKKWKFKIINLTENMRSKDDLLNNILNDLRDWKISSIKKFKTNPTKYEYNSFLHIMPYNYMVDNINMKKLSEIKWLNYNFKAIIKWKFNLNNVLASDSIDLKVWAKVMIVKNLMCWLVNWDLWIVKDIDWDNIIFYSDRLKCELQIFYETWLNKEYDINWEEIILGSFTQLPVRLAYGITAHKSQWLTLDNVIFHYNKSLSKELCYVACSRVRTFEWLYIINT